MVLFEGWSFHEISVGKIATATIGIVICRQIGRLPQKYKVGGGGGVVLKCCSNRWRQTKSYLSFQKTRADLVSSKKVHERN